MARNQDLPIDKHLDAIRAALKAPGSSLVLQAQPGAGKTTRVPPALLGAVEGEILVLEPRRLAAKMSAQRVASELGEPIGQTVGYHFRFENVGGPRTRLRFLTEGMFIRLLLRDATLAKVSVVILDEFHERSLHADVALAAIKRLQSTSRPDLKIVVMSATIDADAVARYLGHGAKPATVLSVEGRTFPVTAEYLPGDGYVDAQVVKAVRMALESEEHGDILVFLPGVGEIRRAHDALSALARERGLMLVDLYGDLSREEQDRAVLPADRTKVILSTNVAETSLTIEGVRTVIDSGLARVASYSWWSGLPSLRLKNVSRASAIQRAGRAGRMAPGRVLRLYGKQDFESRAPFETPEIARADLSQTLLELSAMESRDIPWFEAPSPASVQSAADLLHRLGAVDEKGALTALGRRMVELPAHPRLAKLALEGAKRGVARDACTLAALLSEGRTEGIDILVQLERYRPDYAAERVRDQLFNSVKGIAASAPRDAHKELAQALLAAFPDRVARKRELAASVTRNRSGTAVELVLSGGGAATLEQVPHGLEYAVTVDIEDRQKKLIVRSLCAIEPEWLFDLEPGVTEQSEVIWDDERERATATNKIMYDQLVLSLEECRRSSAEECRRSSAENDPASASSALAVSRVLAEKALAAGLDKFCDAEELKNFLLRVKLVGDDLPAMNEEGLRTILAAACEGLTSFKQLREINLLEQIQAQLRPPERQKLDRLAPTHAQLMAGRKVKINYEEGKPPWIESRLQDFFGMKAGPSVLGGRVPLTLHLLAPNYRAVQVTSDLAGFWTRIYPALRKDLGRRYPRHKWPEDPLA